MKQNLPPLNKERLKSANTATLLKEVEDWHYIAELLEERSLILEQQKISLEVENRMLNALHKFRFN